MNSKNRMSVSSSESLWDAIYTMKHRYRKNIDIAINHTKCDKSVMNMSNYDNTYKLPYVYSNLYILNIKYRIILVLSS